MTPKGPFLCEHGHKHRTVWTKLGCQIADQRRQARSEGRCSEFYVDPEKHADGRWCWQCATKEQIQDYFDWIKASMSGQLPRTDGWQVYAYDPQWQDKVQARDAV